MRVWCWCWLVSAACAPHVSGVPLSAPPDEPRAEHPHAAASPDEASSARGEPPATTASDPAVAVKSDLLLRYDPLVNGDTVTERLRLTGALQAHVSQDGEALDGTLEVEAEEVTKISIVTASPSALEELQIEYVASMARQKPRS